MASVPSMKLEVFEEDRDQATAEEDESAMEQDLEDDDDDGDPDSEDYIEEEMLLFADFEKHLTQEELADPNVRVKVIGIETEHPVIQINNDVYKGTYDFALGTNVFLEEDEKGKASVDSLYCPNPAKLYKLAGQTTKVLKMERIFITPKTDMATVKTEPGVVEEENSQMERYLVSRTYEEALNLHLPEGHFPPRHIELEHNCERVVRRKATTLTTIDSDIEDDARRDNPGDSDYVPGKSD